MNKPRRWLLLMKITIAQILISSFSIAMAYAVDGMGQEILNRKISIDVEGADFHQVLLQISKQAKVKFAYSPELVREREVVSLYVDDEALSDVLARLLGSDISYKVVGRQIVLRPAANSHDPSLGTNDALVFEVSGTVYDAAGVPLPGVNILVKGTTMGTTTDVNGAYTLEVESQEAVLVFSFIGYVSQEIKLDNRTTIDVTLTEDIQSLSEVVVVGYGTQKKSDVTGSVARVETAKTADLPNYSILQSLQGRVPGLNITTPDRPGEDPGISVRGTNSISAGNSPLVVVDGIIYNGSFSDFNANDIATVDILKDASAAAVYGSRAANGVLLITTKSGTTDKPQFNFSSYYGIQKPDQLVDIIDGPGYLQKVLDFREATGLEADPNKIDDYITPVEGQNRRDGVTTDWMDHVIRTGVINNYHLDVSGRTEKTNYYIAGTYFKQEGIVHNDDFDRITLNLNLTNHITDWYSVTVKSMFSTQDRSGREASLTQAYRQSPYGNFYDENGPGGYALLPVGDPLGQHPFTNTLIENKDIRNSLWGLFSNNIDVPFLPGLKWTLNASANLRGIDIYEFFDNKATTAGQVDNGIGTKDKREFFDWTVDNILSYRKMFSNIHSLDVTLLYSREQQQFSSSYLRGNNFFTQELGYNNLGLAQVQQIQSNSEDQNSIAYMGRINYGYDDRYAITLTARRDGFSGFSESNKYATFPSIALAWTATNEAFLNNVSWLNYMKLRLSYGKNGNQAVGRYQSLARMNSDQYVFQGTPFTTIYAGSMANNQLGWETTITKNLGVDFNLFHNKLSGSVDVYSSDTRDVLLEKALPEASGYNLVLTNVGEVHNQGVELALNSMNVSNENLSWESGFVFTRNRNRIDKLTGKDADGDGIEDDDIGNAWFIGESLFSIYGYQIDGIYQLDDSDIHPGFEPGEFRIVDTDGDNEITPEDRIILGNKLPNYSFSISNTVRFKNFTFYILVNSIQGGNNYYVENNSPTRNTNHQFTTYTERFNIQDVPYWTPNRPSNEYPIINYNPSLPHPILEDRSFVRIQDVSLSYRFNDALLEKMSIMGLRFYVSAKNLYTFTKWTGYDPENATTLLNFPLLRTYTVGVDFKF